MSTVEKIKQDVKLNFPKTIDEYKQRVENLKKSHDAGLQKIIDIPRSERTFANTFGQLIDLEREYYTEENSLTFHAHVNVDKDIRDVANDSESELNKYSIDTNMREDLYNVFAEYLADNKEKLSALTSEQQRVIKKVMEVYEKNGLQLPLEQRNQLKTIKKEINELSIQFGKNVAEDKSSNTFTKEELAGVPEDILELFKKTEDGKYIVTCKAPEYFPLMKFCNVTETRKKMDHTYGSRCISSNVEILQKACKLRHESAKILGKQQWSDVVTQYYMSQNSTNVNNFLTRMTNLLKPHGLVELTKLAELKKKDHEERGIPLAEPEIKTYDTSFYNNMMLEKEFSVDTNLVKQYFPLEFVTNGIFEIYQELLGFKFQEEKNVPFDLWHPEVKMFSVTDPSKNNEVVGYFFFDLHPREGKYNHFAVWPLQQGFNRDGQRQLPVAALVGNFTKSTESAPSLLTHDEVVTFFHEFGHVMHNMSTTVGYPIFSGTSVERDFVECPSQLFEQWCWDASILNRLSGHYKDTNNKLPSDLIKKMLDAKNLNISIFYLRQLVFGIFDQKIHSANPAHYEDITKLWSDCTREISTIVNQTGTSPAATFGHMFGYDAGYYSYMWSEVFAADIFSVFEQRGVMNKELGKKLRDEILAVGGSQDSNVSLKNFLGRTPDEKPFLKLIGL